MTNEELEQRLRLIESRLTALEAPTASPDQPDATKQAKPMSIKEFLLEKKPESANNRVAAIAYYLEVIKGQEFFSAEDIRVNFRAAKVPAPKNVNDAINQNIAKGLVMESGDQTTSVKTWVLTTSGEKYVEAGFTYK